MTSSEKAKAIVQARRAARASRKFSVKGGANIAGGLLLWLFLGPLLIAIFLPVVGLVISTLFY